MDRHRACCVFDLRAFARRYRSVGIRMLDLTAEERLLFHCYGLGQVARLVYVFAEIIGKEI